MAKQRTVGQNLQDILERKQITQVQLADLLSMRQPSVWKLLHAKGNPTLPTIFKLSKALNCTLEELVADVDSDRPTGHAGQLTITAQLVIRSEGPSSVVRLGERWSLNLVVAGVFHRLGPLVNGETVQDAATKFVLLQPIVRRRPRQMVGS